MQNTFSNTFKCLFYYKLIGVVIMRVLMSYEMFFPYHGGIESHIFYLSKALKEDGFDIELITSRLEDTKSFEKIKHLPVHREDSFGILEKTAKHKATRKFRQFFWAGVLFSKYAKYKDFDLMHAHLEPALMGTSYGKLLHHKPVVWTLHGTYYEVWNELVGPLNGTMYKAQQKLNTLFCPWDSMITADEFTKKLVSKWGVDPDRVTAIPNAIDPSLFKPLKKEKQNKFTVLAPRRLVTKNGVHFLIEAARILKDEPIEFWLVGGGSLEKQYKEQAKGLKNVIFFGDKKNEEMPDFYRKADVVAIPSLAEATSIAGLEALAMGIPLITSDAGGLPEINIEGETGVLFKMRNVKQLADKILYLKDNQQLLSKFGQNGRKRVQKHHTWDVIAKKVEKVYEDTVK